MGQRLRLAEGREVTVGELGLFGLWLVLLLVVAASIMIAIASTWLGSSWPGLPKRIPLCRKGFRDRSR